MVMILTFSRGGLYFIAVVAILYLLFNRQSLGNYFKYLMLVPVALIGYNFVVEETGGAILKRYDEKGSSNRDVLAVAGYKLFLENPVIGVGTSNFGYAIVEAKLFKSESTAHNEFIRALAEHGIFGFVTYWGFFIFMFLTVFTRKEPQRQFSIYFLVLFCLIVVHNGLKISIQPMLLVLAVANPSNVQSVRKRITNAIKRPPALQQSA
jgi:O-antigen ligase